MEIDKVLGDLYEDIHWILLISGNVLTLDTDGETTLIPPEIMRYSLGKSSEVNVETSLRVLASPGEPSSSIPGTYTSQCGISENLLSHFYDKNSVKATFPVFSHCAHFNAPCILVIRIN